MEGRYKMNKEFLAKVIKEAKADKKNAKIAKAHYTQYENTHYYNLWDCYTSYSHNKIKAFEYCENLCNMLGGWGLRIISHNMMQFTVGFEFADPNTGELMFAYITRDYDRFTYL